MASKCYVSKVTEEIRIIIGCGPDPIQLTTIPANFSLRPQGNLIGGKHSDAGWVGERHSHSDNKVTFQDIYLYLDKNTKRVQDDGVRGRKCVS